MNTSVSQARRLAALSVMIGHTPLLALQCEFRGKVVTVFAKAEFMNLTGSIKDRIAIHILKTAYETGRIQPGDYIIEASSGNTGIALAAVGRALGHRVIILMPDWMSPERVRLMQSFGARVELISHAQGGFCGGIAGCELHARELGSVFLPRQFSNIANADAHQLGTGTEIVAQMRSLGLEVSAFVAGVGTGGTVMGVGRHLRTHFPKVRVHPLEPAESPTLTTGVKNGQHRIQGISDEFIPPICKLEELDEIVSVSDGDAIRMAQMLAEGVGLGVGISSGANLLGALMVQELLGPDATVVTVFCDDNKKYMSTDLFRSEPRRDSYVSSQVVVTGYQAYVCPSEQDSGPGYPRSAAHV